MAFFKTSTLWVIAFRYDGRPRQWFKTFGADADVWREMTDTLRALYGKRVQLVEVRTASEEENLQYVRGDEPQNVYCPTGR